MKQNQKINRLGLGDILEKFFKFIYVDRLVKKLSKFMGYEDCGCTRRKNILNKIFRYKKWNF